MYILKDDGGAALADANSRLRSGSVLLQGMTFVVTKKCKPEPKEMGTIIEAAGGSVRTLHSLFCLLML